MINVIGKQLALNKLIINSTAKQNFGLPYQKSLLQIMIISICVLIKFPLNRTKQCNLISGLLCFSNTTARFVYCHIRRFSHKSVCTEIR